MSVLIDPPIPRWTELIARQPRGELFGRSLESWRQISRGELGLPTDRPIIATGHQAVLWHPGILAKYLAVDAFARAHEFATANLIVDQDADDFAEFDIPIRRADGSLAVRTLEMSRTAPRRGVPMGRHEAIAPAEPPDNLSGAIPSMNEGVRRILDAVSDHQNAPNAALQMTDALADLMKPWARSFIGITATNLMETTFTREIMRALVADPHRCAESYNRAVAAVPDAGIGPLMIRDDYVELPLWRIRVGGAGDGTRMHAYDNDIETKVGNPKSRIDLMPRALFMTALARLVMCDLFIHGTGGAIYDRAMELWISDWLGIEVCPHALVTADVRLPLLAPEVEAEAMDAQAAIQDARRIAHDPEPESDRKRRMLAHIETLPRNSPERKAAFLKMHEELERLRQQNTDVQSLQERAERAKRLAADVEIARRRDWAFPLYPPVAIDELAGTIKERVTSA